MEIFGFSAAKIIVILIIAIVIFGPAKVPEMARTVGRTVRDVRRYIKDMTAEFDAATGDLREEFTAITHDLQGELAATQADLRRQRDLTDVFAEAAAPGAASPPYRSTLVAAEQMAPTRDAAGGTRPRAAPPDYAPTAIAASRDPDGPSRRATKADPLADLSVAAAAARDAGVPHRNGRGATPMARAAATPRRVIGRSVAGSAYLRRTGGRPISGRERYHSPCRRHGTIVHVRWSSMGHPSSHSPSPLARPQCELRASERRAHGDRDAASQRDTDPR